MSQTCSSSRAARSPVVVGGGCVDGWKIYVSHIDIFPVGRYRKGLRANGFRHEPVGRHRNHHCAGDASALMGYALSAR